MRAASHQPTAAPPSRAASSRTSHIATARVSRGIERPQTRAGHCPCGGGCPECRSRGVTRGQSSGHPVPASIPSIVQDALRTPGQPLDAATRAFMEPRLGHDLAAVRVHTDQRAADSARAVQAQAYTVGQDVVFADHKFERSTEAGRELLAHELAHSIQQRQGIGSPPVDDRRSPHEESARAAARSIAQGHAAHTVMPASGIGLARSPDDERAKAVAEAEALIARMNKEEREEEEKDQAEEARRQAKLPGRSTTLSLLSDDPRFTRTQISDLEIYEGKPERRLESAMKLLDRSWPTHGSGFLRKENIQVELSHAKRSYYDSRSRTIVVNPDGSAAQMAREIAFEARKIKLEIERQDIRTDLKYKEQQKLRDRGLNYDPAWEEFYEPKDRSQFVEDKMSRVVEATLDVIEFNKRLQREGETKEEAPLQSEYETAYKVTLATELPKDIGRTWRDISPDAGSKAQRAARKAVEDAVGNDALLTGLTGVKYAEHFGREWEAKQAERAGEKEALAKVQAENRIKDEQHQKVLLGLSALASGLNTVDPDSSEAHELLTFLDAIVPLVSRADQVLFITQADRGLDRLLGPFGFRMVEGVAVSGLQVDRLEYGLANYFAMKPAQRSAVRRGAYNPGIQTEPTRAELAAKDRLVAVRTLPDGSLHVGPLWEFRGAVEQNRINHALEQLQAIKNAGPGALIGRIFGGEKGAAIGGLADAGLMIWAPAKARQQMRAGLSVETGGAPTPLEPVAYRAAAPERLPMPTPDAESLSTPAPAPRVTGQMSPGVAEPSPYIPAFPRPVDVTGPHAPQPSLNPNEPNPAVVAVGRVGTGVERIGVQAPQEPATVSYQEVAALRFTEATLLARRATLASNKKQADATARSLAIQVDFIIEEATNKSHLGAVRNRLRTQESTARAYERQIQAVDTELVHVRERLQLPREVSSRVPSISMGDVKSMDSYREGLRHVSRFEGEEQYNTTGNVGIAMYDSQTGDVVLQVFGPRVAGQPRRIIFEEQIGRVAIPAGRTPTQIGNEIEEPVRKLVRLATKQPFPGKSPHAHGPDLLAP